MGRTKPSLGAPPAAQRKDARAKRAKQTVNKSIPALLQAYPRARRGIEASELIVSPPAPAPAPDITGSTTPKDGGKYAEANSKLPSLSIKVTDTLQATSDLIKSSRNRKVCILNMASALRPGGGFLNGATSQEESLCMRSTLYPALREEFYRLPEVGAIFTPDVLVFRSADGNDLPKNEHFFIDVISAAMLRDPDLEEVDEKKVYANAKDRELVRRKMVAVLRIARSRNIKKLVLGAWGCGAFGNPVNEIARAWKEVLLQSTEDHCGEIEVVFAIKERGMALAFCEAFGQGLEFDDDSTLPDDERSTDEHEDDDVKEFTNKIADLEAQITTVKNPMLKERLQATLRKLREDEGG